METVVNVKTQEEWDFVTKQQGYLWNTGRFDIDHEKSCIYLDSKTHASIEHSKTYGYKIISIQEYCNIKDISNPFIPSYELW